MSTPINCGVSSEWRCVIPGEHCFSGERTFDNEADAMERARTYEGIVQRRDVGPWESVEVERYFIAHSSRGSPYLTKEGVGATYGPVSREEAERQLDGMGCG